VSKGLPFVVSPPASSNFIEETLERAQKLENLLKEEVKLIAYAKQVPQGIESVSTPLHLFEKIKCILLPKEGATN
ncbi:MAG: hypothetical protein DRJ60_02885, partial [Thermoprotei archaeon]